MGTEIPLSKPDIHPADIDAVAEVLRSDRLSIGPQQEIFEQMVAERCNRQYGIAVSSGTAGLHLILAALGIGPGDEVITTPFSFIASANAVLYVGARPVFVDIDPRTLNMDPTRVEAAITDKTKAILAVEVFGNPEGMDAIASIAQRHEIPLIEDACEALGATLRGRPAGSFGRAAVFGFYPNKQITTGEGGMVVTDDDRLAQVIRSMRNHGRAAADSGNTGGQQYHERLGYNYRLSELAAALGVAQMRRLDQILTCRREVACLYIDKLMEYSELILPTVADQTGHSWFVFVVRLSDLYGIKQRDRIMTGLRRHDVGCSNYFPPIHLQPFYREKFGHREGDFPVTETVAARTIALPFFTQLEATQVELVALTLQVMLQREQLLRPQE
ncbi:MAG: DegT/DnrJ/EryC1/StrS family aminotransferase [Phycisphaeraceae bacterium]|nr:DegT/DnrJ/EryC1/StrS family aminotransferase [Phycisphaeraceae bacterium]